MGNFIILVAKLDKHLSNRFANFLFKSSDGTGNDCQRWKAITARPLFDIMSLLRNFFRSSHSCEFLENMSFVSFRSPRLEFVAKLLSIDTSYLFLSSLNNEFALASRFILLHFLNACSVLALQLPKIRSSANCKYAVSRGFCRTRAVFCSNTSVSVSNMLRTNRASLIFLVRFVSLFQRLKYFLLPLMVISRSCMTARFLMLSA
jgi:hypothetical protein